MTKALEPISVLLKVTIGQWSANTYGPAEHGATIQDPTKARVEFTVDREAGTWRSIVTSLSSEFLEVHVDAAWLPIDPFLGAVRIVDAPVGWNGGGEFPVGGRIITRDGGVITGLRIDPATNGGFLRDRFLVGLRPGAVVHVYGFIAPCAPADADGDGSVGSGDVAICLGAWGATSLAADVNRDGVVDAKDLAEILAAFTPPPQQAATSAAPPTPLPPLIGTEL